MKKAKLWGQILAGLGLWTLLYTQRYRLIDAVLGWLGLDEKTPLGGAVAFFCDDVPKVLLLLVLIVFAMGVVRSFFSPARTRALLAGKHRSAGHIAAAGLGVLTPFCSCSAVPLFIGFVSAGVPLGVTFSFLISAPMVNEVALGLLFVLVGWKMALAYLGFGLTLAVLGGWVIGRFGMEDGLEDWVRALRVENAAPVECALTLEERLAAGGDAVRDIVGKVWPWVIVGISVGAFIHGYAPTDLLASVMGRKAWWSVPAAVLIGVPMYANAAGIVPVVEALLEKGAALGTALAFMMAVTALSLPEMVILRKVLKPKLIAIFLAIVSVGILLVGYLFNALLS